MKQMCCLWCSLYYFYAVIYSLEYSATLCVLCIPIPVSMSSLLTSYQIQFMQNIPFTGAGGDWPLTPS